MINQESSYMCPFCLRPLEPYKKDLYSESYHFLGRMEIDKLYECKNHKCRYYKTVCALPTWKLLREGESNKNTVQLLSNKKYIKKYMYNNFSAPIAFDTQEAEDKMYGELTHVIMKMIENAKLPKKRKK